MKLSYVYILKCSDGSYYTGVTSNLGQRLFRHNTGYYPDCYTANRRPLELVFYCEFTDITIAIEKEKQIKNLEDSFNLKSKLGLAQYHKQVKKFNI